MDYLQSTFRTDGWTQHLATLTTPSSSSSSSTTSSPLRINYLSSTPYPPTTPPKATILLIHGFPQTSYQFRHVICDLSAAGYHVVAPDYRGAGQSSKPASGYEKTTMAEDLYVLVKHHLKIERKVHVVGLGIGGMIAFAYVSRYPDHVASVVWGECELPGTTFYDNNTLKTSLDPEVNFHLLFHRVPDLPEYLIAGKEREYLKHFFDRLAYRTLAITPEDLEHYALAYKQPGALRAAMELFRALERDGVENRKWLAQHGRVRVPALVVVGEKGTVGVEEAKGMAGEYHEGVETVVVEDAGHYVAEENPALFTETVRRWIQRN
ncbi:soluble epoxide hydrolase [Pyrenophora seminiperda CCB06]|uniref:Soluble epoxide hydrolase n=1 Tax=Pyrenophora seminiperda CCB06 TaxID=1302712 RepID=A0A3M7M9B1_9PLEO|nr:soluble epoxide hydrolase [Pyrenophora seminiperda CCB06]